MKPGRTFKILKDIMKNTHTDKIIGIYVVFVVACALLIWALDPGVNRFGDALWYCYSVLSTAGFGDVVVTGFLPRILSVLVTVYTIFVVAIVTGVVVNYYNQMTELRNRETIAAFMDKLERLPELTKEELADLSERVSNFRNNKNV